METATAALAGALDLIAGLGGGVVEGYSEPAGSVPAGFLFNGALSTYEQFGFTRDRNSGTPLWVAPRFPHPPPPLPPPAPTDAPPLSPWAVPDRP